MGTCQEVRCGDLVLCLFDVPETPRTVGLSPHNGMITGAYTIFECDYPRLSQFLEAFYIAMDDRKLLSPLYSGLRNTIPPSKFLATKTPIPTSGEQTAIVRFLDHADRRIQRYLRAKERLSELLMEQKKAIIHQAVTGQIDVRTGQPYPAYKDSRVEWLGKEVPEHWEVRRLKTLVLNVVEQTQERRKHELYLALEHVESWTGKYSDANTDITFDSQVKRFRADDVLFGKLRPYLAKVTRPNAYGVCVGEFLVLRANGNSLLPAFLECFLRSPSVIHAINRSTFGARMPRADWRFIGDMKQLLPPFSEQADIVEYLNTVTSDMDAAIACTRCQIELLQEYRTRLIADVVTGKLDVRKAAVNLPDQVNVSEPLKTMGESQRRAYV